MMNLDVTNDVLILLADILGTSQRVLSRADPRDRRFARIRRLAAELEEAVLHHWADAAVEASEDERQLHLELVRDDDLPF
jgi:hypothetical protein